MALPYPITSYASRHVDLTGGLLEAFEDFIIARVTQWADKYKVEKQLQIMSDRELADLGLVRDDIALISKGKFQGGHHQRLSR
jgi:uncharacterized protein YjiS (DUF1127 family)